LDTTPSDVVDLLQILADSYNTPWVYALLAFGYAILVAVILPIPIEVALLNPLIKQDWGFLIAVSFAIAAGKTIGAWIIFVFGLNIEGSVRKWSERWRLAAWVVTKAEKFVGKTGYTGVYLLLSIPLMSDTIPIYVYSLFNKEGKSLEQNMFLIANFLAALNRVAILGAAFFAGKNLFNV
jgi:membrane protein DedA with SNARE-associated domain